MTNGALRPQCIARNPAKNVNIHTLGSRLVQSWVPTSCQEGGGRDFELQRVDFNFTTIYLKVRVGHGQLMVVFDHAELISIRLLLIIIWQQPIYVQEKIGGGRKDRVAGVGRG